VFEVLTADDPRWLELWQAWAEREVHAHPEYVRLYEEDGTRALCAVAGGVLYAFLLRSDPVDVVTPYGYGGAFRTGEADADAFWRAFDAWAVEQGAVSELVRFSLFPERLLPYPGEREPRLVNVVRDLEPPADELWMDYEHKVRKNVNKARRSGLRVEIDETGARLDDFVRLYEHTLDRRDASSRYRFPRSFFERIRDELAGHFAFAHVLEGERVVSSELALLSATSAYSFLGGTDEAAFELRPNDLLKVELMLWAKEAGKRRFVLGGGQQSDDGIFRYKRSFAPHGLVPFELGMRVLRPEVYEELTRRAGRPRDPGFFPAYRV
jgi:CelD/BcsL family acetyltransferase involved in cellulose biosynthesis